MKSLSELNEKEIYELTGQICALVDEHIWGLGIAADYAVVIFDKHGQLHWRGKNTNEGDLNLAVKMAGIEMAQKPEERTHTFR